MMEYQEIMQTPAFRDVMQFFNQQWESIFQQILLEKENRQAKESTDTLRGRCQMISSFNLHLQTIMSEGFRANKELADEIENR